MKVAAVIALGMTLVGPAKAGPYARSTHARVDLVAESAALAPAGTVTLGLRFALDDGWHIYWRNPGESGGAPAVTWNAPGTVSIGKLEWPTPIKLSAPGDTTYGYLHGVMLLANATADALAAGTVALRPVVEYQICKDVCMKETARPALTLSIGAATPGPAAAEIAEARKYLPAPMPREWKATTTAAADELTLTIATGRRETAATFLPYQPDLIDDSAPQRAEPRADGVALHIKMRNGAAAPASLDGLVVRPGAQAVEVHAAGRRSPVAGSR